MSASTTPISPDALKVLRIIKELQIAGRPVNGIQWEYVDRYRAKRPDLSEKQVIDMFRVAGPKLTMVDGRVRFDPVPEYAIVAEFAEPTDTHHWGRSQRDPYLIDRLLTELRTTGAISRVRQTSFRSCEYVRSDGKVVVHRLLSNQAIEVFVRLPEERTPVGPKLVAQIIAIDGTTRHAYEMLPDGMKALAANGVSSSLRPMTQQEVSDMIGCDPDTIHRWAKRAGLASRVAGEKYTSQDVAKILGVGGDAKTSKHAPKCRNLLQKNVAS